MVALNRQHDATPTPEEIAWCRELVRITAKGAIWGIPRSNLVFKIDHDNKQLQLISGDVGDSDFAATRHVFSYIGWTVVDTQ